MNELKAGVSKVNITPPIRGCQAGFGNREGRPSIGIHDDLYAKAIVLEKDKVKTVIVTTDVLGFDTELTVKIKKLIFKETGIKNVLLSASHTHCGPLLNTTWYMKPAKKDYAYMDVLSRKIAGAVYMAANSMSDVKIRSGIGKSKIGVNRRPKDKNGKVVRMGEDPNGLVDIDVPVFIIEREDGNILAVLFNYACHPVAGGVSYYISADYPGYTQSIIEDSIGCIALFTQGTGADINPKDYDPFFSTSSPFALAGDCGKKIANAVLSIIKKVKEHERNPYLAVTNKKIPIPVRKEFFDKKMSETLEYFIDENKLQIKNGKFYYEIYLMQVGSCLFVGIEGESCVGIGLELKKRITEKYKNIKNIFIVGYMSNSSFYVATSEMFNEGGYEVDSSILDKEASSMIINSILNIVDNICK